MGRKVLLLFFCFVRGGDKAGNRLHSAQSVECVSSLDDVEDAGECVCLRCAAAEG